MWVSFDPRKPSICGLATVAGGLGVQWWAALRSPARLAQLAALIIAFCFSLQPMTAYRPGLDGTPQLLQQLCGCKSCATGV